MDRYAARLLLTAVMLGTVAVSATLFSDALTQAGGSEPLPVQVQTEGESRQNDFRVQRFYLSVHAQTGQIHDMISVLDEEGMSVGNWQTEPDGSVTIGPLAPGIYYARALHTDYVCFSFSENAQVSVQAGSGWADGEQLFLTKYVPSRLDLCCTVPQQQEIVTLELVSADGQNYLQTGYVDNGSAQLTFDGLPAGTYELCRYGEVLQSVQLDGQMTLSVTLP